MRAVVMMKMRIMIESLVLIKIKRKLSMDANKEMIRPITPSKKQSKVIIMRRMILLLKKVQPSLCLSPLNPNRNLSCQVT
jgi:hypothetical protein